MDGPDQPRILQRLEARRERHRERGLAYRVAWVLAGFAVTATGVAMLVLPGPAVVVIPAGLAMLSFEFAWAQWLLDHGVRRGQRVGARMRAAPVRAKLLGALALACAAGAVAAAAVAIL